jgi:spoIIIJ-associated protein
MSDTMKSTGKTVDEAVREALLRMGLRREEVSVTVLQESRGGFLGMGRREAVVEVAKKSDRDSSRRRGGGRGRSSEQADGGGDGRRGRSQRAEASDRRRSRRQDDGDSGDRRRGRRRDQDKDKDGGENRRDARQGDDDRNAAAAKDGEDGSTRKRRRRRRPRRRKSGAEVDQTVNAQSNDQQTDDQQTSGDQGRGDQSRGGRGRNDQDRNDAPAAAAKPDDGGRGEQRPASRTAGDREPTSNEPAAAEANEPRQETRQESRPDRQSDEAAQGGGRDDQSSPAVATDVVAINRVQPFGSADAGDQLALLERAATSLMVKSGFQTRVSVQEGDYHKVKMVVDDRSAGVLIGRQGSTVDAVEHLVERIATRTVGERVKLNLDINNYRLRREDGLLGRTRRAINEARETGEPVHMDPAGGRERRIVHLEVVDDEDLVTYTEMDEDGKHVVICRPEQVPDEYRDPEVHGPAPERTEETAAAPETADESEGDDESGGEIEVDVKLVATSPTESAPVDEPEPGNEKPADPAQAEDERRADA